MSNRLDDEIEEKKEEYENFFKIESSERKDEELTYLRRKLREQVKQRTNTEIETHKLKNKVKALKLEEDKAWKKIENTKKAMTKLDNVRKNLLSNKILLEELKSKREKELDEQRRNIQNKFDHTKDFLENWRKKLAWKKNEDKAELKTEKKKIMRKINVDKQEIEEKNKQTCIKIKTSKINFVDKKMKTLEDKKKALRKEILNKLNEEVNREKQISEFSKNLVTEENEIKKNLNTIENSNIEDSKSYNYYIISYHKTRNI